MIILFAKRLVMKGNKGVASTFLCLPSNWVSAVKIRTLQKGTFYPCDIEEIDDAT